jgi:hypothetical protein
MRHVRSECMSVALIIQHAIHMRHTVFCGLPGSKIFFPHLINGTILGGGEITEHKMCVLIFCKGKSVLLQSWSGPEGSRKLRFPVFMTTAQEGGKVVSLRQRPHLPPGNSPGTNIC